MHAARTQFVVQRPAELEQGREFSRVAALQNVEDGAVALCGETFGRRACQARCIAGVRIVDQHRDPVIAAQLRLHRREVVGAFEVGHHELDPHAAQPPGEAFERGAVVGDQDQVASAARQAFGVGRADAASGTGDQGCAAQLGDAQVEARPAGDGRAASTCCVVRMAWANEGPLISCAACSASGLNAAVASRTRVTW